MARYWNRRARFRLTGGFMEYWTNKEERKKAAQRLIQSLRSGYKEEIDCSIAGSKVWDLVNIKTMPYTGLRDKTGVDCIQATTVDAVMSLTEGKNAALNFASYKNPGGMFIEGSAAQEESLCHSSILYPVLKSFQSEFYNYNRNHLNKALYQDRLIYSEDILFFDGEKKVKADVITCACPNWGAYSKYNGDCKKTRAINNCVLKNRFQKLYLLAGMMKVDALVLGAWGCGVFKQDPEFVASTMLSTIKEYPGVVDKVVFAVPDDDTYRIFMKQVITFNNER